MQKNETGDTESRFWAKVDKTGDCWIWKGSASRNNKGYGDCKYQGKTWQAHKVAYHMAYGQSPDLLRHTCDVRLCVNPEHLVPGTAKDNSRDMVERGRSFGQKKTHCPQGHEYSDETTYIKPNGNRNCKPCLREANRRWRSRK